MNLTKGDISKCKRSGPWDMGNQVLYDLCANFPKHRKTAEIIVKVWLIGRSYAASIERRTPKKGQPTGDRYYTEVVAPAVKRSCVDTYIQELRRLRPMSENAIRKALEAHRYLTALFRDLSDKDKRSLSSKYLHFHMPEHFFLFDNRAQLGLRLILPRQRASLSSYDNYDRQYATHFLKLVEVRKMIEQDYHVTLTPREIDKLLLEKVAAQR